MGMFKRKCFGNGKDCLRCWRMGEYDDEDDDDDEVYFIFFLGVMKFDIIFFGEVLFLIFF